MRLKCWLDAGLEFFYPSTCQICGGQRSTWQEGYVCRDCRGSGVKWVEEPLCRRCGLPYEGAITGPFRCSNCAEVDLYFRYARAAVVARGLVLEVIHRYKYQRALWFEPFLADLLVRQAEPLLRQQEWDMIVPVPLHPVKEREREFNQASRLAIHLGRRLRIPVNRRALRRTLPTRTQTLLSKEERTVNIRRAFSPGPNLPVRGSSIILFDDVFTTGATTNACARILRKAGAADICVWTVARGL